MAAATAKKGLGRGLSALIPDADMEFLSRVARGDAPSLKVITEGNGTRGDKKTSDTRQMSAQKERPAGKMMQGTDPVSDASQDKEGELLDIRNVEWIPVNSIGPNPYQPRRAFKAEEMEELVASVREHGILQPILVRPAQNPNGSETTQFKYQLIAGERRWRAAQQVGVQQIPAIVREVADQQALELALIENVQRHDITALDAALAYRRLAQEFSLSQDAVAQRVGKSRSAVANTMRLLDLPAEVQKAIEEGALSEGHGRAILLADGDGARRAVFRRVLRERLSVRATEELARQTTESTPENESTVGEKADTRLVSTARVRHAAEIKRIEEALQKALKTRVGVKPRAKGGQVILHYFSNEDLQRLLSILMAPEQHV